MKSLFAVSAAAAMLVAPVALAGPPGPPGSPEAEMKTLDQIEPRTIITGLPFTIDKSGVYYLTANLHMEEGGDGIMIKAGDVKLDLNGFSLNGGTTANSGVAVIGAYGNITIQNGVIRNWDGYGIDAYAATTVRLSHIKAILNKLGGIRAGTLSEITKCQAYGNTGPAITTRNHCVFAETARGSTIEGNTVADNNAGIASKGGNLIARNTAYGAGQDPHYSYSAAADFVGAILVHPQENPTSNEPWANFVLPAE